MEEDDADSPPEPSPYLKPSMALSWATLGFVLGGACVILWPPAHEAHRPPAVVAPAPEPAPKKLPPMRLSTIEDVFEAWSQYAVWDHDSTEVALFDTDTNEYSDFYQIVRTPNSGAYFFRTIPRLDRPVLTHGVPDNAPLKFTETEEQRQQWLHAVDDENAKAFRKAIEGPPQKQP